MNTFGPDRVVLDLSRDEHRLLIYALGFAAGGYKPPVAQRSGMFEALIQLADHINEDNPNWTPYAVKEPT